MDTNPTVTTVTTEPQAVAEVRRGTTNSIRYSGFDQRDNTRFYVFQYIVAGEKSKPIVVSADIPLLVKHHVRIQDGPALCLYTLISEASGTDFSQAGPLRRLLTVQDVLAFLASQPVRQEPKGRKEKKAAGEIV
jgi:hypothetical protein